MAKRIVLAGVLGGLAMFMWSFIAHMVLGLGLVGIKDLPSEQAVLTTMHENVPQSGMYLFPALTAKSGSREQQNAAMKVYQDKIATGPSGILIYHPSGQTALSAGQLLTEFGTNVVQGVFAALLLSLATGLRSYASRVAFVTAAGVLAAISTNISYWNWYGFPGSYTAAYTFTQVVGFICIGLIAAGMIKHRSGSATKAAGAA